MNARYAQLLDRLRRICRCGHVHYATRCHVCKYSDHDLAPEVEAPRPQPAASRRPDAGTRFSGAVALVALAVVAGVVAMGMLQSILERVAG